MKRILCLLLWETMPLWLISQYFFFDNIRLIPLCGKERRTRYYYLQKKDSPVRFENSTALMKLRILKKKSRRQNKPIN